MPIPAVAQFPVMGLWTTCTRLKIHLLTERDFRLTFFPEGVELNRSLTASKVFPVGAASGAQAQSPSASRDATKEGK
jgi:hypothetical protein